MKRTIAPKLFSSVLLATAMAMTPALATADRGESATSGMQQQVAEGWRMGSIQASLLMNTNLNPLDIKVEVDGNEARLSGHVDSDVNKQLAEEIALSVDGIDHVDNRLEVDADKAREKRDKERSDLRQTVSDTAVTTQVKTRLLANSEVSGTDIEVSTDKGVVKLSGEVESSSERDLAYYIARNTRGVQRVDNDIDVRN